MQLTVSYPLSRTRRLLRPTVIPMIMAAIILLPAMWNGFPFVFPDTGGYLVPPFTGHLQLGRSALYGAFLAAGSSLDFWPNIVAQALLTAWIVSVLMRTERFKRPATAVAVIAALCVCTSLPWYAGQLQPDVFLPLSVLAFYLIVFAPSKLHTWEIVTLAAVVAFSIALHMSIFALLVLLFVFNVAIWAAARIIALPRPRLVFAAISIAAGVALAILSNSVIAGVPTLTPGGSFFLFGRLVEDGFVKTYLDQNCPSAQLSLCKYRDSLPTGSDYWLWGRASPLVKLGGWRAFAPEGERIVIGSLLQQPGAHAVAVLKDTLAQLLTVATGEGFDSKDNLNTELTLKEYAPRTLLRYSAAAQQHNAINFGAINLLHIPLALGATLLLPFVVAFCWLRQTVTATLGLTVCVALLANAAVSATFSGIHDRYQSRIASIALLAVVLACLDLLRVHRRRGRVSAAKMNGSNGWLRSGDTIRIASCRAALRNYARANVDRGAAIIGYWRNKPQ